MSAREVEQKTFEVLWHKGYSGYNQTEIEAVKRPLNSEAAQIVAVKEDEDVTQMTVDSIREVKDE